MFMTCSGAASTDGAGNIQKLLTSLTSVSEAERFAARSQLMSHPRKLTKISVESALTSLRPKNVSTLIFVLMEHHSDILYHISEPARMNAENTLGSFPNIAYYYAAVRPEKGFDDLRRLYEHHPDDQMAVCKAIGKIGGHRSVEFLFGSIREKKKRNQSVLAELAGLKLSSMSLSSKEIKALLSKHLNRDEIILAARIDCRWTQKDMIRLYLGDARQRAYVLERVFYRPDIYFQVFHYIITDHMQAGQYDTVRRWMLSDALVKTQDQYIKTYRDMMMKQLGQTMNH